MSQPQRFVFQSYAANLPRQDNPMQQIYLDKIIHPMQQIYLDKIIVFVSYQLPHFLPHIYSWSRGVYFSEKSLPPLFAQIIFSPKRYICCEEGRLNCTHCTNLLIFNCKLLLWNHVKTTFKNLLRPNATFMTKLGYMTKWCYITNYLSHYLETDLKN